MPKCQICRHKEAINAWQPFGPGPTPKTFTVLGHHYRGFPVIKVCESCKNDLKAGIPCDFELKGKRYIGTTEGVIEIPDYVDDTLSYWEETA